MQSKTIRYLSGALLFGLVVWGLYVFLSYYGVIAHGAAVMDTAELKRLAEACGEGGKICRGFGTIFAMIFYTLGRMAFLLPYLLTCLVVYGIFLGKSAFASGKLEIDLRIRPWHILLIFVGLTWLMFSVLSTMDVEQSTGKHVSVRRILEPTSVVYPSVSQEAMESLQDKFAELKASKCLIADGEIIPGVGRYYMRHSCIQRSFITKVLTQMVFLLLIAITLLTAGRFVLRRLGIVPETGLLEFVLSLGTGVCLAITWLWLLAVFGVFYGRVGWASIILVLLAGYPHARYWLLTFFTHSWEYKQKWYSVATLLCWLLLSYLALNFITVIRPFPIGWDDLGSYLNRPRLLVSYGSFIYSMSSFQWEYMTSLGYLLYGYKSIFGATSAMVINWSAGLFAIFTVLVFARQFLGSGRGLLAALIYYTLPLIGHFSYADMKTDNAVFALQALAILCLFIYLFTEGKKQWQWLVLSGVFCSFAFGTKITAAMTLMALGAVLLGAQLHWSAFLGIVGVGLAAYGFKSMGLLGRTLERVGSGLSPTVVAGGLLVLGLAALGYALQQKKQAIRTTAIGGVLVLGTFIALVAPWMLHNNWEAGRVIPKFTLKAPNTLAPAWDLDGTSKPKFDTVPVRELPLGLQVDTNHPACSSSGREEELGRYWGFREGWRHYLTLPWRTVMNKDSAGYYVTTSPALLLFPLLLLLPFFWRPEGRFLRWLFVATLFVLLQWGFLANGVPWYGIIMLLGLVIGLEALVVKAPDPMNRSVATGLITLSLIGCFGMRFWQFDLQRNLIEYTMGKSSADVIRERTIPHYDDISALAVYRHNNILDRPYLYRMGTFIPYFIPKNLEVIGMSDQQLDRFNCLYQERDNELTVRRLKALGFNSIIFDTNTATIEKDLEGSLHKKVEAFIEFVNAEDSGLDIVVSDTDMGVAYILIP